MARLPSAADLTRRKAPANTPVVSIRAPDYSPLAAGSKALSAGANDIMEAGIAEEKLNNQINDFDTKKRLLDFQLQTEMEYEDHKRNLPPGGAGFTDSWNKTYRKKAAEFVGKDDATIPENMRGAVGFHLKQHEVRMSELAQRDEWAERDRSEVEGLEQTLGVTRSFVEADPTRRDEMRTQGESLIESSRIQPAAKDRLRKHFAKELDKTAITTRIMKAQTAEERNALMKDLAPEAPDKSPAIGTVDFIKKVEGDKDNGWDFRQYSGPYGVKRGANEKLTLPEAEARLKQEVSTIEKEMDAAIKVPLDPNQRTALTSLFYNIGTGKGRLDQVANLVNNGQMDRVPGWIKQFTRNADGGFMQGLADRRNAEAELFSKGGGHTGENGPVYAGPYSTLTLPERKTFYGQLVTEHKKAVTGVADELKKLEDNALTGHTMPAPMLEDLGKRVQELGEPVLAARYHAAQAKAQVFSDFQKRAPEANEQQLQQAWRRFATNQPTPEDLKHVGELQKLVDSQRSMLKDDKLTWAYRAGSVPVGPLDFNSDDAMKTRLQDAYKATMTYGGPIQYFTKPERESFQAALKAGGPGLLSVATRIASSWGPEHASRAMAEISDKVPEAAVAGYLVANNLNPQTAQDIATTLQRQQDPNYRPSMLPRTKSEPMAIDALGDVYRNFPPQQRDAILRAADAVFEARIGKSTAPDTDGPDIYKKALLEVIGVRKDDKGKTYGGPVSTAKRGWFGSGVDKRIMLPPTWKQETWRDVLEGVTVSDLAAIGHPVPMDATGKPLSMVKMANANLVQVGPDKFAVALGDPDTKGNEQWASTFLPTEFGAVQKPFVLDFTRIERVMRKRMPGAFWSN